MTATTHAALTFMLIVVIGLSSLTIGLAVIAGQLAIAIIAAIPFTLAGAALTELTYAKIEGA